MTESCFFTAFSPFAPILKICLEPGLAEGELSSPSPYHSWSGARWPPLLGKKGERMAGWSSCSEGVKAVSPSPSGSPSPTPHSAGRRGTRKGALNHQDGTPTLPFGVVFGCMEQRHKYASFKKQGGSFSQVRRNVERSIVVVMKTAERAKSLLPGCLVFFFGNDASPKDGHSSLCLVLSHRATYRCKRPGQVFQSASPASDKIRVLLIRNRGKMDTDG